MAPKESDEEEARLGARHKGAIPHAPMMAVAAVSRAVKTLKSRLGRRGADATPVHCSCGLDRPGKNRLTVLSCCRDAAHPSLIGRLRRGRSHNESTFESTTHGASRRGTFFMAQPLFPLPVERRIAGSVEDLHLLRAHRLNQTVALYPQLRTARPVLLGTREERPRRFAISSLVRSAKSWSFRGQMCA
jgi:hypothetical protein